MNNYLLVVYNLHAYNKKGFISLGINIFFVGLGFGSLGSKTGTLISLITVSNHLRRWDK